MPAMPNRITETWIPNQAEFDAFARLSGDDNPIHIDPGYCATTPFKRPVSHGMLIYARLWALAMRNLPGLDAGALSLMFPNPAYAEEPLELVLEPAPEGLHLSARRLADGAFVLTGQITGQMEPRG